MHNVLTPSDTLLISCNICCEIFRVFRDHCTLKSKQVSNVVWKAEEIILVILAEQLQIYF